jgi:hypothetical protein
MSLTHAESRPCMYCVIFSGTDSQCECGAAICSKHKKEYGALCPLCKRLGVSHVPVFNPNETLLHLELGK